MRLFLVIDEIALYHPSLVSELLRDVHSEDSWVGAAVIPRSLQPTDLEQFFRRSWRHLSLTEIVKLALRKYVAAARDGLFSATGFGRPTSVSSVLNDAAVPVIAVDSSINDPGCIRQIEALHPDVLVCSTSSILNAELLAVASRCCLNRHASLLPAYRGRLPLLHAIAAGEQEVGVSIHVMTASVDHGVVLRQRAVPLAKGDTLASLYRKCFEITGALILESLDMVRANDFTPVVNGRAPSYFGAPTLETFQRFRANGGRVA